MLSIDRVRTTTLSLLGLGAGSIGQTGMGPAPSQARSDRSDRDEDADPLLSPANTLSDEDPVFAAVETALKDAGYLDS